MNAPKPPARGDVGQPDPAVNAPTVEVVPDRHVHVVQCVDCDNPWHYPVTLTGRLLAEEIADIRRTVHASDEVSS